MIGNNGLFCWNVRGFNRASHRRGFRKWYKNNKTLFGGIIETHVKQPKEVKFIKELFPDWNHEENYQFSELGRIWVVWHPMVKVTVIAKSLQMITCLVKLPDMEEEVLVSTVYASNEVGERNRLWYDIIELAQSGVTDRHPWLVMGDFNQTLNSHEHSLSHVSRVDAHTRKFRECLREAELFDLAQSGNKYTWWNKSILRPIAKKLDRVLVNEKWCLTFPDSLAHFGEPDFSDHSSISIQLEATGTRWKKPFKFLNLLLLNEDFIRMIELEWLSTHASGSAMFRLSRKLKALKKPIRDFSRTNYSGIEKRVMEAHGLLLEAQSHTLSNPSVQNAEYEIEAQRKWSLLVKAEERFFQQRSRVLWLREGDSNTAYFHRMADARKAVNNIKSLEDDNGNRIETMQGIHNLCLDHFEHLLGTENEEQGMEQSDLVNLLDYSCSNRKRDEMEAEFSDQEIKQAFFSLPRNKTSGPDGFSAEFFKSTWHITGPEVTAAVREFFVSGRLLHQWNATTLVLIPKSPHACKVTDFRPISCLNTVYKAIAKLLTARLKALLEEVISSSQSAFLPGRSLAQNVLLATELVKGYNGKRISPRGMLKIDLRKAFDTVSWEFILASLRALNIPERYVGWIAECITTPSFTISVNGNTEGHFKSSRGLRQGDPLSPYLFVLVMEVFSKLLKSRYDEGMIGYHPKTHENSLSHLMFADDIMLFFDGSVSSIHGITETLDDFGHWSGLRVNMGKSSLYTAGINARDSQVLDSYGFRREELPITYLGLPLMSRKLKISEYEHLLEKLTNRFRSWAVKSLSFAGRSQLIKSVISGTINFWLNTFLLPKGCIKRIESLCSRFLWSGSIDEAKGAKISWDRVCLPKKEGGLGIRRFAEWNKALCLKLIWGLFTDKRSLWTQWHTTHHLRGRSFWALKESPSQSWSWRNLLRLRPLAARFLKCRVENGTTASFWFDSWSPLGPIISHINFTAVQQYHQLPLKATVSEALRNCTWLTHCEPDITSSLQQHIDTLDLTQNQQTEDAYTWYINDVINNEFSASGTWEAIRTRRPEQPWMDIVWHKGATPRLAFHMWVTHMDRLPTRHRLAGWGVTPSASCYVCPDEDESRDHLFIHCPRSVMIWGLALQRLGQETHSFTAWIDLLKWSSRDSPRAPSLLRKLILQVIIYHIWKQRNAIAHNNRPQDSSEVFRDIDMAIKTTIASRRTKRRWKHLMQLWLR